MFAYHMSRNCQKSHKEIHCNSMGHKIHFRTQNQAWCCVVCPLPKPSQGSHTSLVCTFLFCIFVFTWVRSGNVWGLKTIVSWISKKTLWQLCVSLCFHATYVILFSSNYSLYTFLCQVRGKEREVKEEGGLIQFLEQV